MSKHIVQPGECMSSIAAAYGYCDWRDLYNEPDNQALRKKRPNAHLLFPGDEVVIPDRTNPKKVSVATGSQHRFVVKAMKRHLEVRMLDEHRLPLANQLYVVEGGGDLFAGKTDGDGLIALDLPVTTTSLQVWVAGHERIIGIGALNPIEDTPDEGVSGIQGRLAGLGFDPGPIDGKLGLSTGAAILAFQRHYELTRSGKPDADTIARLKKEYGA